MLFNQRLRLIRIRSKQTQKNVAEYLGITLRTYQRYEEGSIEPPLSAVASIGEFFGVPVDCLLGVGLFANWEEILLHKNVIFGMLGKFIPSPPDPTLVNEFTEGELARIFSALFSRIVIEGSTIDVYPLVPLLGRVEHKLLRLPENSLVDTK